MSCSAAWSMVQPRQGGARAIMFEYEGKIECKHAHVMIVRKRAEKYESARQRRLDPG